MIENWFIDVLNDEPIFLFMQFVINAYEKLNW